MLIEELLANYLGAQKGDFNDLSPFDFVGVYIIYDKNTKEVVYIGSAYVTNIKNRLSQYISPSDTGNTLGKTIAKSLAKTESYDDYAQTKIAQAVNIIKNNFFIIAIPHEDLEYKLIKVVNPKYNNKGKAEV